MLALLKEEKEKETPIKQRLTAARIHRILQKQGHHCSGSLLRKIVREVKWTLTDPLEKAFLPLSFEPGQDAQVDFFEAYVYDLSEGRVKIHVLLVRPCFSRRTFLYAVPNQTQVPLFEGLMQSFEFFGGVFSAYWFDNLTPAVRKVLKGRTRVVQEAFLSELEEAQEKKRLHRLLKRLGSLDLLIVDELGYLPMSEKAADLLFQAFSERDEEGSVIVNTNLAFSEWGQVFRTERLAVALLDRLTHQSHLFEINGGTQGFPAQRVHLDGVGIDEPWRPGQQEVGGRAGAISRTPMVHDAAIGRQWGGVAGLRV